MEVYNCYNIVETPKGFIKMIDYLIKDLGKPKFHLDL